MSKTYKVVFNGSYGGFSLSEKATDMLYELGALNDDVDSWSIERHNPHLVKVVEELGDLASSSFSNLKIAEITSSIYKIDEYDGAESVITPDKIAWVKIEQLNSNTERLMKVGDSVWHVYFTLTGQVYYPGKIIKIDGEYGRIYCRVAWPDGVEEGYEEHELSLDDPRTKE